MLLKRRKLKQQPVVSVKKTYDGVQVIWSNDPKEKKIREDYNKLGRNEFRWQLLFAH